MAKRYFYINLDYNQTSLLSLLDAYFSIDFDEKRQAKLNRVEKMARGFGHLDVVDRIQQIMHDNH